MKTFFKKFVMILFLITFGNILTNVQSVDAETVVLRAVKGLDARLPCGQGMVLLDGPASYLLWLKNEQDFLYRFPNEDNQKKSLNQDSVFGTSCEESTCYDATSLLIKGVSERDEGTYCCRIHNQDASTFDYIVHLKLVDSPAKPKIYDKNSFEIKTAFIEPLSLGSDLLMTCEVGDDQPDTLLYWRRNGVEIEEGRSSWPGVHRAEVRIHNASRDELNAHYSCSAQNADVTPPLTTSVVVHMYLPPLSVEIRLNNNLDFEAGQPRVVDCVVIGCVPPPTITWHLGGVLLRSSVHKELHDGNYTVSSMTLAASLRDTRHDLVCRAHNLYSPNAVFQDTVTLNVGYRPFCLKIRDEKLAVMSGEAESVTCVVEASPEPMQFSWTFADSRILYTSVKKVPGHVNRYSSTLTWQPRESDIGTLHCRALNAFGEQKRPCTSIVVPGGPPAVPECVLLRSYPNGLRVQCKKGWDGGRAQSIQLTLLDETDTVLHNVSDSEGDFTLTDLEGDKNLTAVVYAISSRGRSEKNVMFLETSTPLSASVTEDTLGGRPWVKYMKAAMTVIAVVVVIAATVLCYKIRAAQDTMDFIDPDLVPRSDGSFHREPDFTREERLLGTTNITVNQLASYPNQYTSSPIPTCRVLVGCPQQPQLDSLLTSPQHSYYV